MCSALSLSVSRSFTAMRHFQKRFDNWHIYMKNAFVCNNLLCIYDSELNQQTMVTWYLQKLLKSMNFETPYLRTCIWMIECMYDHIYSCLWLVRWFFGLDRWCFSTVIILNCMHLMMLHVGPLKETMIEFTIKEFGPKVNLWLFFTKEWYIVFQGMIFMNMYHYIWTGGPVLHVLTVV